MDQVLIFFKQFCFISALFISFEQPNYIVSEDDGTITVGLTLTGSTALTLEFG
jgi:hypothetical protein